MNINLLLSYPYYLVLVAVLIAVIYLWPSNTEQNRINLFRKMMSDAREEFASKDAMILFHLPNCKFCRDMMPEWNKFQAAHQDDPKVTVYKVDGSKHPEIADTNKIRGFPTVIKVMNGKKTMFTGERTAKALEEFLKAA
jgi:thioredoxin-like negative regulator of GroEL